jgi:tryptophan 2,3-dioxygenase
LIPNKYLDRDFSVHYEPNKEVQNVLLEIHQKDPETSMICERLVDIDEGLQEWRYRHVKMVERTIGHKIGTGGSSGVDYLNTTISHPVFVDLWAIRDQL